MRGGFYRSRATLRCSLGTFMNQAPSGERNRSQSLSPLPQDRLLHRHYLRLKQQRDRILRIPDGKRKETDLHAGNICSPSRWKPTSDGKRYPGIFRTIPSYPSPRRGKRLSICSGIARSWSSAAKPVPEKAPSSPNSASKQGLAKRAGSGIPNREGSRPVPSQPELPKRWIPSSGSGWF